MYLATGPEADARRVRAIPLIAEDLTRPPDSIFAGPDLTPGEAIRWCFFGET